MRTPDFHTLLTRRAKELRSGHADIARWMSQRGVATSKQSVHQWATGQARPEPWKWSTLLDVLGIAEPHRVTWRTALEAPPEARA